MIVEHQDLGYGTDLKLPLTEERFPAYAKRIAYPKDPYEHSPSAIARLMDDMKDYVIQTKKSRWQFRPINKVTVIDFDNIEDYREYQAAWAEYVERCSKINKGEPQGRFRILAEFTIFRRKAEAIRFRYLCRRMLEAVNINGKAALCATNYIQTIVKCIVHLVKNEGIDRRLISIIWGGDHNLNVQPISEQQFYELGKKINRGELLKRCELKKLEHFLLHKGESNKERQERLALIEECKNLGLGTQTQDERQKNKIKFLKGESLYCFFTTKAGGVALSLHHCDDKTKEKVRRHDHNGYAYLEDIKNIPTRPRVTFAGPCFSAIETVQMLGRAPRITSLSDTYQEIIFYGGTAEEDVALILGQKLKCLSKVVMAKEGWEGAIYRRRDSDAGKIMTDRATIALIEESMKEAKETGSVINEDSPEDFSRAIDYGLEDEEDEE